MGLLPADAQCVRTSQSAFLEIFCTAGSLATSLLTSSVAIAISLSASVWFFSYALGNAKNRSVAGGRHSQGQARKGKRTTPAMDWRQLRPRGVTAAHSARATHSGTRA